MGGAGGETRTRKPVKAGDFESPVSPNSTTPAVELQSNEKIAAVKY